MPNYDSIIGRSEAGALIPPEMVQQVVKVAAQESRMRQDMRLEISDSAVVQDDTGAIIYNSWQQDSVVGRLTFRAAYAVANPVTKREPGATGSPFPFAVLDSGGTLLSAQRATARAGKRTSKTSGQARRPRGLDVNRRAVAPATGPWATMARGPGGRVHLEPRGRGQGRWSAWV